MRWLCIIVLTLAVAPALRAADEGHSTAAETAAEQHDAAGEHAQAGHERDLVPSDRGLIASEAAYTIVVFLIFFGVLSIVVWPRILAALRAREDKQRSDLVAAEQANADAKLTLAEYQKKLADAHAESRKLIEQARVDADKLRDELQKQTDQEMHRLRQRATEEIGLARQQAVADLHAHAAELAVAVAAKILQRQITPGDTEQLVRQSLGELEKVKNN